MPAKRAPLANDPGVDGRLRHGVPGLQPAQRRGGRTPARSWATAPEILGLWIAWAAFRLTQTPGHPVTPVLAPFLIAPPVIDCLVLIVRRLRAGRSPFFFADRNHLHHLLMDAGLSSTSVVVVLTGLTLAIGFACGETPGASTCQSRGVPGGLPGGGRGLPPDFPTRRRSATWDATAQTAGGGAPR